MKPIEILTQALELIAALTAAPLFLVGSISCRAWLAEPTRAEHLAPLPGIRKLFHKDALIAESASRSFAWRLTSVFGAMVVAAGIIPFDGH